MGESTVEGAVRETWEEARARVAVLAPHALLDLPHIGQSYTLYRARLLEGGWAPGPESLEVESFALDALPWDELAFPVIHFALRLFVEDAQAGVRRIHLGVVRWGGHGSRFDPAEYELQGHLAVPLAEATPDPSSDLPGSGA
jgi:8-oxo-dGTP pyrophosphatase MutT (NUDIX family)